ncbi:serine--tRNA ligase [Salicibibacter halophilus]|uniref:Serine--tRNA ligase n=1 Tax=Salicibibacter halophilus TaxID=2502791 RepID=A0A514LIF6_9BACI|nr:serine--tRNA ligase [Salicibibacter halophilus]QDI91627.1 serine--tRNA ligase [Salicibibacter halophilus]
MLDIKYMRQNEEKVKKALAARGIKAEEVEQAIALDEKRRDLIVQTEDKKKQRNEISNQVAERKRAKEDAGELITQTKEVSRAIKQYDEELRTIEENLQQFMLTFPNLLADSVPEGETEEDNVEVRQWGTPPAFSHTPQAHWDLGAEHDMLDFERSAKVTGSRFVFYKGAGARLERALIQYMMDVHADEHGYTETLPPYIVNHDSMVGTGQLPKFEEDMFALDGTPYYMIPTSEVPIVNMHRNEILDGDELNIKYVAYSSCFRAEAGSAGRDTRGLIRQHQFSKVELIWFTKPEDSYEALAALTGHAEKVLQELQLPYRVLDLCSGDIGFAAAKTYDLEVWLPSYESYKEISSCSNCEDFQARRANIKFKREQQGPAEHVHTLNGSGLAVGRTVAAIMENYQDEDGSIRIPAVLQPYMGGKQRI